MHFEPDNAKDTPQYGNPAFMMPIIDKKHFSLFTDGCEEQEAAFISTFFASAFQSLQELRTSCSDLSFCEQWRHAAHRLKGTAAQIGAQRLSDCCRDAEMLFQAPAEEKARLLLAIEIQLGEIRLLFNAKHIEKARI